MIMGDVYNTGGGGLVEDTLLSYYIVLFIAIIILSLLMVIKTSLRFLLKSYFLPMSSCYCYEPIVPNRARVGTVR